MKRKYRQYSEEDVIRAVKENTSMAGVLRTLNLRQAGGNYANMKKTLQRLRVTTDHWTEQGWTKDQQLKDWSEYRRAVNCKKHLIKEKGHACECCGLSEWMGAIITLELHHVDGDRTNNKYTNLQLLCPNCHSLTDNWRNKKRFDVTGEDMTSLNLVEL